jgi:hypothetical protein
MRETAGYEPFEREVGILLAVRRVLFVPASERGRNNSKCAKDFYLKGEARI